MRLFFAGYIEGDSFRAVFLSLWGGGYCLGLLLVSFCVGVGVFLMNYL